MSMTRIKTGTVGFLLTFLLVGAASAQKYQPFIDPGTFKPDYQWFAPVDVEEYGGEIQMKTGWFATYDRLYVFMSRPNQEASFTNMDSTWGNRFNFGYMTEEQHGWLFSATHINSPGAADILTVERINRWRDPQGAAAPAAGQLPAPLWPSSERNDSETQERTYDVTNSLNYATLSNFEVNKTFRLDPYHRGTIIEPFFGARYMNYTDMRVRQTYDRYTNLGVGPLGVFPNPNNLNTAQLEQLITDDARLTNDMFGGQVGFRAYHQHSRWTLSGEVRAFGLQNFQALQTVRDTVTTQYAGVTVDTDSILQVRDRVKTYGHASEFVFGTEVRASAAFALTRDISMRFGVNFLDLAKGIGRGADLNNNAQDVQVAGFDFGLTLNW